MGKWRNQELQLLTRKSTLETAWIQVLCCVCAKSLLSCLTLCDPMDLSPPGSSVNGILQARILEWVAMPSSRRSSELRDRTRVSYVSCIGRWVIYHWHHLRSPPYAVDIIKDRRTVSRLQGQLSFFSYVVNSVILRFVTYAWNLKTFSSSVSSGVTCK